MAKKIKSRKKLNPYTELKNNQPPVQVIKEAKIVGEIELPESKAIVSIKSYPVPIGTIEEVKIAAIKWQEFLRALITEKDLVEIEGRLFGKKSAVNKICLFGGVSREPVRAFEEERIANKDYWKWNKKLRKNVLIVKKGEIYRVAKTWVKAILSNGVHCTRGGAASETDRKYAHDVHDLMALSETRAMCNAVKNLLGIEFEIVEEEGEEKPEVKTYKPKPNQEQGYKRSGITRPELSASLKQKEYIQVMIDRLKDEYGIDTELEKPIEELNKGEAADLIRKLLAKGKKVKELGIKKEIPTGEPPEYDRGELGIPEEETS